MHGLRTALVLIAIFIATSLGTRQALSQDGGQMDHAGHMGHMDHMDHTGQAPAGQDAAMPPLTSLPKEPGQGAFAAIQEIVAILEADPATDWSHVDIRALREHLVDMDELILRAEVMEQPTDSGFTAMVTGRGRTLEAIRRMVPAHARMIDGHRGWKVEAEHVSLPAPELGGVVLTVSGANPAEIAHLKGLGFFGVMASGAHHQTHHLGIAKGEHVHGDQ